MKKCRISKKLEFTKIFRNSISSFKYCVSLMSWNWEWTLLTWIWSFSKKSRLIFEHRVAVGLGWTRARASNPRIGQGWTHSFCSRELNGFEFLFERIDRVRILVRRIELNRHTCSSSTQFKSRLIQKSRIEWSILGLNDQVCSTDWAEQAILSEPESWASLGVLILGLGFEFCSSNWVGLKKSVRTQPDGHIIRALMQRIDRATRNSNRIDEFIWFHSKWCKKERSIRFNLVVESSQLRTVTNANELKNNFSSKTKMNDEEKKTQVKKKQKIKKQRTRNELKWKMFFDVS
jgi:hypothetical protein